MTDELPPGWTEGTLSDVFDNLDSQRIPINSAERTQRLAETANRYPYYGATGQVGEIDDFLFDGEAVLLGEDGAPFLDARKRKAYLVSGKYWVNNHAHILRAKAGMSNAFFCHQLNAIDYRPYVAGTTRLKLTQAAMNDIRFVIAPAAEQQRIVSKIDELFSRIDEGERALERVQKLVERYRQSVLKAAVTGELTRDWREKNKDKLESGEALLARILMARREAWEKAELDKMKAKGITPANDKWKQKYQEPTGPNIDSLPVLPEKWAYASVEQICFVDTGATPKRGEARYFKDGTIDWITSTAVNDSVIKEAQERITQAAIDETNAKIFPVGSFIVAMYGEGKTRGRIAELGIAAATNQACAALICGHLDPPVKAFVRTFFEKNYAALRASAAGGVQPNLNLGILKKTVLPIPPLFEMDAINNVSEAALSQVSAIASEFLDWDRRSMALRQRILSAAFTGSLVNQEFSDEPASEMLVRIDVERVGSSTNSKRGRKPKNPELA